MLQKIGFSSSNILSLGLSALSIFLVSEMNHQAQAIVTTDDPDNHIVNFPDFNGVVFLQFFRSGGASGCTGSLLLPTRQHILTAAHCFTGASPNIVVTSGQAIFPRENPDSFDDDAPVNLTDFFIHPGWDGSTGDDLAIATLEQAIPSTFADAYGIYRDTDEIGQVFTKVGYGRIGQGGSTDDPIPANPLVKRFGQNQYDTTGNIFSGVATQDAFSPTALIYDFDSGLAENDLLADFGIPDLGLGLDEASGGPGDSGGPSFINGLIAGITSGGTCLSEANLVSDSPCLSPPDIDTAQQVTFGEFGFDTRISDYADYIDDVLAGNIERTGTFFQTTPEPNSIFGLFALSGLAILSRCQKNKSK